MNFLNWTIVLSLASCALTSFITLAFSGCVLTTYFTGHRLLVVDKGDGKFDIDFKKVGPECVIEDKK